jgi:hypothetical protein
VTVYLKCDPRVPEATVFRAISQSSQIFAGIGVSVQFTRHRMGKPDSRSALDLDLDIQMDAPPQISSAALALSHPFRSDGRIEVFYSRIQRKPIECRDLVLAYVLTHEITHALEGTIYHSSTGVMKEKWTREDFNKMQAAKLEFEPRDVFLIRTGIEKSVSDAGSKKLAFVR